MTQALNLPSASASVHVPAHTHKTDVASRGNALADSVAQALARGDPATPIFTALMTDNILHDHQQHAKRPSCVILNPEDDLFYHPDTDLLWLPPSLYPWA